MRGELDLDAELAGLGPDERAEVRAYHAYHRRRYELLLAVVAQRLPGRPARILDVGPNLQTLLLRRMRADVAVDTLGLSHPLTAPRPGERHIEQNLDEVQAPGAERGAGEHDVVVMAEVIEHLHTAAPTVLGHLAGFLRPGGSLVVQTPNAVALHKRLRMAAGRNPYEPIRASRDNPGHFHEYTAAELEAAAREAGLQPGGRIAANYFGGTRAPARAYAALGRALPPGLRHGLTIWLRRPGL